MPLRDSLWVRTKINGRVHKIEIDSCRLTFISQRPGIPVSLTLALLSQQPCTCADGFPLDQLLRAPFQPGKASTSFSAGFGLDGVGIAVAAYDTAF